jgi:Ca2+-binding EF-hand superfamily protein
MASNQYDSQASTNYKEAFSLFDKRGNGRVALESLGDLLRACGQNPTLAEIRDLEKSVGGDCMLYHAGWCCLCHRGVSVLIKQLLTVGLIS